MTRDKGNEEKTKSWCCAGFLPEAARVAVGWRGGWQRLRLLSVSTGVLGLARHFAHHQNLLQGFLHVLVHLALSTNTGLIVSAEHSECFQNHFYLRSYDLKGS